jgi:hypothetical protein
MYSSEEGKRISRHNSFDSSEAASDSEREKAKTRKSSRNNSGAFVKPKSNSQTRFNWAGVSTSDDETNRVRVVSQSPYDDSSIQRVTFPKEWDMMLPDRADVIKEAWKNAWRRFVFYVFFFALLVYLRHFPAELQVNPSSDTISCP